VSVQQDHVALVARHRDLDSLIAENGSRFLSDWNCDNPFLESLLQGQSTPAPTGKYVFLDTQISLLESICAFHKSTDRLDLTRSNLIAGAGSSSFLTLLALWLRRCRIQKLHYLPPVYYTVHHLCETLGIERSPVTLKHAFQAGCVLNLPDERAVLLLCDPIWYAGVSVPQEHIDTIRQWQQATGSLVIVDGSFQYLNWGSDRRELSATLDPDLTLRIVCPTKALAIPAYRFAYLLLPARYHEELLFLYESLMGSSSVADLAFASRSIEILSDPNGPQRKLAAYLEATYRELSDSHHLKTAIVPRCGYFAFGIPARPGDGLQLMDETFFELTGYPGYARVNLFAARRIYGLKDHVGV
jgi:aspartate/methionine/tyrosine aminotransferase